jgi:hypothetical protein
MKFPEANKDYLQTLEFVRTASLYKINDNRKNSENKKHQSSLAAPLYKAETLYKKIEVDHPSLLRQLNDSSSKVPAYAYFQCDEDNLLRQDLRSVKAKHF